jgi:hypothetical protein
MTMKTAEEIQQQVDAMKQASVLPNIQPEESFGLVSAIQALEWVLGKESDMPLYANTERWRDRTKGRTKIMGMVENHE